MPLTDARRFCTGLGAKLAGGVGTTMTVGVGVGVPIVGTDVGTEVGVVGIVGGTVLLMARVINVEAAVPALFSAITSKS